jgi:hypothetical protein
MDVFSDLLTRSGIGGQGPSALQSVWTNLACLALTRDPATLDALSAEPFDPGAALVTPQDTQTAVRDGLKVMAAAGATAGYSLARHGVGPEAGRLFWRSWSTNQLQYAESVREATGNGSAQAPSNLLLRSVLWGMAGSHLLSTLLGGKGIGVFMDAAALAASAWLSRALCQTKRSDAARTLASGVVTDR